MNKCIYHQMLVTFNVKRVYYLHSNNTLSYVAYCCNVQGEGNCVFYGKTGRCVHYDNLFSVYVVVGVFDIIF